MRNVYFILVIFNMQVFGQQEPLSGMFWNNYAHFNPAVSGVESGHQAALTYRNQWVGLERNPKTLFANYNTILLDRHGLGVNYLYDVVGYQIMHKANLNYNYQFKLNSGAKLTAGIAAGLANVRYEPIWSYQGGSNWTVTEPIAFSEKAPVFNSGLTFLSRTRRLYAGFAVSNISPRISNQIYHHRLHLSGHFRYKILLSRKMQLIPETIIRTNLNFFSADLNLRINYLKKLEAGLSYRNSSMIGVNASWLIKKQFKVGYMAEYTMFNPLSNISRWSHEFVLGFNSLW